MTIELAVSPLESMAALSSIPPDPQALLNRKKTGAPRDLMELRIDIAAIGCSRIGGASAAVTVRLPAQR